MLKGNPMVFHYTTFKTADKLFAKHPIWQQAKIEAERKLIFEEYVDSLKEHDLVSFAPHIVITSLHFDRRKREKLVSEA
jgi:hypothetical protein